MGTRTEPPDPPDLFRSAVLKALAHPARLRMLDELRRGERCVCELRDLVDLDLSTVSKHLALLRAAGLVADERRGAQVFYQLCSPEVTDLLADLEVALDRLARRHAEGLAESCGCRLAGVGAVR
jgi:ArsR family transcriptional regulator